MADEDRDEEILRVLARHGTPLRHGDPAKPCRCWAEAQRQLEDLRRAGFMIGRKPTVVDKWDWETSTDLALRWLRASTKITPDMEPIEVVRDDKRVAVIVGVEDYDEMRRVIDNAQDVAW